MGSWRADEPSPHRLHRCTHYTLCQTVRSYKTITPKMSAFGTSTPTTRPPRGLVKPWALPTPKNVRHGRCRRRLLNPCTPTTQSVGSPPTSKGQGYAVASQALTGFPLRPLRIVLLHPRRWKGVKATQSCISPLTPWTDSNTQPRGMWIGFATCPCGLASESGVWAKPQGLAFWFLAWC